MSHATPYPRPAEVTRLQALAALGMDVSFERGEGSRIRYRDPDEHEVWDFLGGYGATFFGHNHPAVREAVVEFMDRGGIVHCQASRPADGEGLARRLADRLRDSVGGAYQILLANTGAEAVEVAARHAEHAYHRRLAARLAGVAATAEPRPPTWSEDARRVLARHGIADGPDALSAVAAHNERAVGEPPHHLAVAGGYHGMTARALSLTEDAAGRFGPRPAGLPTRFVDPGDPDAVERALHDLGRSLLRPRAAEGAWELEELPWVPVAAFFFEPIQGEGGIRPVLPAVARGWRAACDRHGVPMVADEIQTGLGRTGTFLYCEQLGVRPDYVLLGKSLGGGVAKISAVAVDAASFLPGFTFQHLSTFADDGLSSRVASRVLELLESEDAMARAAARGALLRLRLDEIARRHPQVIAEVRGAGLMLGIEWRSPAFERSNTLDLLSTRGLLGYAVSAYLLRRHGVRVAPTLGGRSALRIQPAYSVPDEAIDRLVEGLEDLCVLLERQDGAGLLAPGLGVRPVAAVNGSRAPRVLRSLDGHAHVGFVGHFVNPQDVALWDPAFRALEPRGCGAFLERLGALAGPALVHRDHVVSLTGARTTLSFVGLAVTSDRFHRALRGPEREELRALVQQAVDLAAAEGCSVVGLGGYTSIITGNGKRLLPRGMAVTTGNAYAVAAGLEAMRRAAREAGLDWSRSRASVLGAAGNIGEVTARILATEVAGLVLVGRPSRQPELEALAGSILASVASDAPDSPMGRRLGSLPPAPGATPAERFTLLRRTLGAACPVEVGTDPLACRRTPLIVAATNDPGPLILPGHLPEGPVVINDLSVPSDVHPEVPSARPDARILRGAVVRTPRDPSWTVPGVPLRPGEMYACMAETVLMGLEGASSHGSFGKLTAARVRETAALAARHGFVPVPDLPSWSYPCRSLR